MLEAISLTKSQIDEQEKCLATFEQKLDKMNKFISNYEKKEELDNNSETSIMKSVIKKAVDKKSKSPKKKQMTLKYKSQKE